MFTIAPTWHRLQCPQNFVKCVQLFCAHACRLSLSHTCLPCSAALRLLPFFACGLLCGYAFHGGWLCPCMLMVDLSYARSSGECCLSTCMHGWQLQAGSEHGRVRIKEDALQTILLAANHATFLFRKLLCGCRSLGFASKPEANCTHLTKF